MYFRFKLGHSLYEKYLQEASQIRVKLQEEYDASRLFPRLHPEYAFYNRAFNTKFKQTFGDSSENNHDELWKQFWANCNGDLHRQELQKKLDDLKEEYLNKKFHVQPNSAAVGGKYSITNALDLLQQMCANGGAIETALVTMVKTCRLKGPTTKAGLKVFTDPDNMSLIKVFLDKLRGLRSKSSKIMLSTYSTAIEWTEKLMEDAKHRQNSIDIDLEAIAMATVGKNSSFIIDMIKTACAYEGESNPSLEKVNDLFMQVCSLHFKLASK